MQSVIEVSGWRLRIVIFLDQKKDGDPDYYLLTQTKSFQTVMEELVADLSLALERTNDPPSALSDTTIGTYDSPTNTPVRIKAPKKRRARKRRSDYPPLWDPTQVSEESNDSMEEALKDYIENITMCQSDSDDHEPLHIQSRRLSSLLNSKNEPFALPERAESDSVSETVIGLTKRRTKRKRKLRRLSQPALISNNPLRTRKRKLGGIGKDGSLGEAENGLTTCGEPYYKLPPLRGQSNELASNCDDFNMDVGSTPGEGGDDTMAISGSDSPKSDSSSCNESEGFFTNDEGRLGDDEGGESTFEHDIKIKPWWDEEKGQSDLEEDKFQKILNGVLDEYGMSEPHAGGGGKTQPLESLVVFYPIALPKIKISF